MQQYLLTILVLLPLAGALAVAAHGLFAPYADARHYRWIALGFSLVTFAASLLLLTQPVGLGPGGAFHFVQDVPWVASIGARYHVGVDGISLWLVILTTLLVPISILSSWTSVEKRELAAGLGEEREVEAHQAVGAHLQEHAREDDAPGRRRLGVRVRQPGVQGHEWNLHRERGEER